MRAEKGEGIGMVGSNERVDLRIEMRIARSLWPWVLRGWTLLGQDF